MKRTTNLTLILSFSVLTFAMTAATMLAWESLIRDPFFAWVERNYPGEEQRLTRRDIQQRVEHFVISVAVDLVVVTLLLRLVSHQQRALAESEERYRALFEHAGDGIGVASAVDLRLTEVNNRFCDILGYTPQAAARRDAREIIRTYAAGRRTDDLARLLDTGGEEGEAELTVERADGVTRPVALSYSTLATAKERLIIFIVRDLSARRRLEAEREQMRQQLYQTAKLASLGELSAGVAHEINNPLNGVINFAQLLKDEGTGGTDFERQMLDGIIEEGERIASIVRGLLTFARHDEQRIGRVSFDEAVTSSLALFGRQFEKDGIRVETDVPADLPPLRADRSRLRQVVLNMVSNAHHALKSKPGDSAHKLFRISAQQIERDGREFVRAEFYDNGVGIRREELERVFDPFYTTRRDSGGTGLGLSISFGIVHDYGGTIRAESEPGEFTRFVVELPADEPEGEGGDGA